MKCWFRHNYRIVKEIYGYVTTYKEKIIQKHVIFLEECTRCGKRKVHVTGELWKHHSGIQAVKEKWIRNGDTGDRREPCEVIKLYDDAS